MKILLALVTAALILVVLFHAVPALSQTEFVVACEGGVCRILESDLVKLQSIINALVEQLEQLRAKGGCA